LARVLQRLEWNAQVSATAPEPFRSPSGGPLTGAQAVHRAVIEMTASSGVLPGATSPIRTLSSLISGRVIPGPAGGQRSPDVDQVSGRRLPPRFQTTRTLFALTLLCFSVSPFPSFSSSYQFVTISSTFF